MNLIKKLIQYKNHILLSADILLIPGLFFFQWLSGRMLARPSVCTWNYFGGKCVTCGGTHFVNVLLQGQLTKAFYHNAFLFVCTAVLLLSYIQLHLWWFGNSTVAKKFLQKVYSIPGLVVFCAFMVGFLILRNISVIEMIINAIA